MNTRKLIIITTFFAACQGEVSEEDVWPPEPDIVVDEPDSAEQRSNEIMYYMNTGKSPAEAERIVDSLLTKTNKP